MQCADTAWKPLLATDTDTGGIGGPVRKPVDSHQLSDAPPPPELPPPPLKSLEPPPLSELAELDELELPVSLDDEPPMASKPRRRLNDGVRARPATDARNAPAASAVAPASTLRRMLPITSALTMPIAYGRTRSGTRPSSA